MSDYVVLLRENPATFMRMSPTEMQAIIQRYTDWFAQLGATGRLQISKKLKDEGGRHVRTDKGRMVASDGPYAEAKDVVSGLFIVSADSYEAVQALLRDCPHLNFGWIEVREVDVIG